MTDTLTQVAFFHEAFGLPVVSHPSIPSDDRVALRLRLIDEEYKEVRSELTNILEKQRYGHEIRSAQRLADLAKRAIRPHLRDLRLRPGVRAWT